VSTPSSVANGSSPREAPLRVWRDGARLVVRRGFSIDSHRCVLCNGRAAGAARLARRGAFSLEIPLCAHHVSRHRRARFVGWGLGLLGLLALGSGLALDLLPLALLGTYAVLGATAYAAVARHLLTLDHTDRHFLRLRGADLRYLDGLRAWGDYPEPLR
jgi:hypothetical protein